MAPLLLVAYAVVVGVLAPRGLALDRTAHAPRLAITLWLALSVSCVMAVVLAGLGLVVPGLLSWAPAGATSAQGVMAGLPPAARAATSTLGLLAVGGLVAQTSGHVARDVVRVRRERCAHEALLGAASHEDPGLGAVILDHESPAAYCLPGGRHRVVVTRGAVARLGPWQLQAVLAHERAHLRAHHQMVLCISGGLARALPWVPLLSQAPIEIAVLAEMAADDAASRRHDPTALADALMIFARASARPVGLTAGGPAAARRVQRLLQPPGPAGRVGRIGLALAAATLCLSMAVICLPVVALLCTATTG